MENLRILREKAGLTQQQLADILNVTQQSISKYESGETLPDGETLRKMAAFFHTTIDYLLGRTDYPYVIEYYDERYVSKNEMEVIKNYRKVPSDIKEALNTFVQESKKAID